MSSPEYKSSRLATLPTTLNPAEYDIFPETRRAEAERLAIRSRLKREYLLQYNDPSRRGLIEDPALLRWTYARSANIYPNFRPTPKSSFLGAVFGIGPLFFWYYIIKTDRDRKEKLIQEGKFDRTAENCLVIIRETGMEVGKGCDLNISSHSKTDGSTPVSSPQKPSHPVMDFFSSHLLGDSSSPGSNSSHVDAHETVVSDFLVSDENLQKMENVLDIWSSGLKTNVISELSKWKLNFIDWHRMEMRKEKEKHAAHLKQLCNQITNLKELQKAYEVSIGRKDEVISSLSHALGKQKERIELMRTFFHWRIGHVKSRQDVYEGKLADQYFQRTLLKKVWKAWHSTIKKQWKDVVERACQARAEEVCVQISNDYEARIAMLSGALENSKAEIQRMQHEKEHFEDSMKKAFMRGVCALNLEAMSIFQNKNDIGIDFVNSKKEEYGSGVQGQEQPARLDSSAPLMASVVPPAPLPSASTSTAAASGGAAGAAAAAASVPSAASITSAGAAPVHVPVSAPLVAGAAATAAPEEMYMPRVVTSAQQKAGRTITARITGRCDFAPKNRISSSLAIMGVSPPMSSVVVEKHHPVTVQTIPQATAAKYPRAIHPESSTSASRSLGTRSTHTQSLTSIPSIKVVD